MKFLLAVGYPVPLTISANPYTQSGVSVHPGGGRVAAGLRWLV